MIVNMKVVIPQNLKPEALGKKKVDHYSNTFIRSSNDGMMRDYEYTNEKDRNGILTKLKKTKPGEFPEYRYSYYYEYTSEELDPKKTKDKERMIIELLSVFNVHEFKIVEPDLVSTHTISDYYLPVNIRMSFSTYGINCKFTNKSKLIADSVFKKKGDLEYDSIESARDKMHPYISSEECAAYILSLGDGVEKNFSINLSLDEIGKDETIIDFRDSLKEYLPKIYSSFDEAEKDGAISKDDIKDYIKNHREMQYFDVDKIPTSLLEELLNEDITLLDRFATSSIPLDVLKKFKPDFSPDSSIIEDSFLENLKSLGFSLFWEPPISGTKSGKLCLRPPKGGCYYDGYLHQGYYIEDLNNYGYNKLKEVVEKVKDAADEAKKQATKKIREKVAREMGYRHDCEFFCNNVPYVMDVGVYVIYKDGNIRDSDYTPKKNTIRYDQILPGEIVVSYGKYGEELPKIIIEWADNPITAPQLDTLCNKIVDLLQSNLEQSEITMFLDLLKPMVKQAVEDKAEECKKELKVIEKHNIGSQITAMLKESGDIPNDLKTITTLLKGIEMDKDETDKAPGGKYDE